MTAANIEIKARDGVFQVYINGRLRDTFLTMEQAEGYVLWLQS